MLRPFQFLTALLLCTVTALAAEFKMVDGKTLIGDIVTANEQGAVIRLADGKLSERQQWFKFQPDTLTNLATDPKAGKFVAPLIAPPPDSAGAPAKKKSAPAIKEPPKPDLPPPGTGLFAAMMTPIGLSLLGIMFVANLFAASEIAAYRRYPIALVCGVGVVLPVVGPVVFLCLKTRPLPVAPAQASTPTLEETVAASQPAQPMIRPGIPDDEPAGPGLSLAAKADDAGESAPVDFRQEFKRGDHIFNRRFFESNLAGFFRVVPTGRDKDLVIVIRSARGDYIGRRISRISMAELHLQVQGGAASAEAMIPFVEINEVMLRHKDAPA